MVHGLPNDLNRPVSFYESEDWTDGCIALRNDDMVEFWFLTEQDTPIEILP
jgi:murein L,D-transpeptidase YafK